MALRKKSTEYIELMIQRPPSRQEYVHFARIAADDRLKKVIVHDPSSPDKAIGVREERSWDLQERHQRESGFIDSPYVMWRALVLEGHPPSVTDRFRKAAYLEAFVRTGTRTGAARVVGLGGTSRRMVDQWEAEDPEFAAALADAVEMVTDDLEEEAVRRAKEGSDALLTFLLKSRRSEQFRDRSEVNVNVTAAGARSKLEARMSEILSRREQAGKILQAARVEREETEDAQVEFIEGPESGDDDEDGGEL